jgi:hypothetical protein
VSDMMQRIEKLEQLHDALCDALQDVDDTNGVINSKACTVA